MGNLRHKRDEPLQIVKNNEITVKVNQKFGVKFSSNYSLPPEFQVDIPSFEKADEGIKFIESTSYYDCPEGWTGGDTVEVNVFKATKKGNFKIKFGSREIKVHAI